MSQIYASNPAGVPHIPPQGIGGNLVTASAEGTFATTMGGFLTILSLTTLPLSGLFRLGWCVGASQSNSAGIGQYRLFNATAGVALDTFTHVPGSNQELLPISCFRPNIVLAGVATTFEIQIRRMGALGSAQGTDPRMELWRQ